jgi:hypothetical protein
LSTFEKRQIYLKLLPDYEGGRIAMHVLTKKVGVGTSSMPFSVSEGTIREGSPLLEDATPDEIAFIRQVAERMHQEYKASGMTLNEWSASRRKNSSKQQSKGSAGTNLVTFAGI